MTGFRPKKQQFLIGALVVITALSTSGTLAERRPGLPQNLEAARVAPGAPVPAPPQGQTPAAGRPPGAPPPAATPAQSGSSPAVPPARAREDVGRPNPFVALVAPTRPRAPTGAVQPSSRPLRPSTPPGPSAPSLGIDLPLPPGFTVPGGQGAPPSPPPGAGMTVGAIIGGSERVAIIDDHGRIFIVGVGDRVGGAVVVQILDDKVVLRKGAGTFELPYGGEGP